MPPDERYESHGDAASDVESDDSAEPWHPWEGWVPPSRMRARDQDGMPSDFEPSDASDSDEVLAFSV